MLNNVNHPIVTRAHSDTILNVIIISEIFVNTLLVKKHATSEGRALH